MNRILTVATMVALVLPLCVTSAMAGPIERGCLKSDRKAVSRAACACIQQVADMTLTGADQRRAAKFFKNPDEAHSVWLSKRAADDAFWERYKNFGATAEAYCGG